MLFTILTYKAYHGTVDSTTSKNTTNHSVTEQSNAIRNANRYSMELNSSQTLEMLAPILPQYLQLPASYNLTDLLFYMFVAILTSELMYHVLCGVLQVYYYNMQRDHPEQWKCQPHRFLTPSNELHEVVVGTANLVIVGGNTSYRPS